jgi:uncharacterized membrane protein YdjX (TVP38/TMEM64 family)
LGLVAERTIRAHESERTELIAGVLTILGGLAVIAAVPQVRHCVSLVAQGEFVALRSYIRSLGVGGFVLLLGLMVLHAIVWYPSEIITTTAGYVYGFGPGLGLAVCGWFLAALVSYGLGRAVGGPVLRRLLGHRFRWLTSTMDRGGISLLLSARLIPIFPFALVGYAAGATHINLWRFCWTTVIGYLPLTVAVAYLGSQAQAFSASNPVVWLAAGALIGVVVVEHLVQRRTQRPRTPASDQPDPETGREP